MHIKFNQGWDKPQFVRAFGAEMESHNGLISDKDIIGIINMLRNSTILSVENNPFYKFKGDVRVIKGLHPDFKGNDHISVKAKLGSSRRKQVYHIYLNRVQIDEDWSVWEVSRVSSRS